MIKFLLFSVLFGIGCNYSPPSKLDKNHKNEFIKTKKKCLNALSEFADTLRVDHVGLLNDNDKGKDSLLKNCTLKDYRNKSEMQSAIVLTILKIYNYDLKQGWPHEKAEVVANMSNLTSQIVFEYAYLYYGKERYYTEDLNVEDIIGFIKKNPILLKNPQIKKQYDDTFKFNNTNSKIKL